MFIAMNRFKIVPGKEDEFEKVWRERDTHLSGVPGFKEFHLVKGKKNDEKLFVKKNALRILACSPYRARNILASTAMSIDCAPPTSLCPTCLHLLLGQW